MNNSLKENLVWGVYQNGIRVAAEEILDTVRRGYSNVSGWDMLFMGGFDPGVVRLVPDSTMIPIWYRAAETLKTAIFS